MNSYEAIVDKLDELVENEPVDIVQIACDCKSAIEALLSEVVALQSENAEKDKEIERLRAERDRLLDRVHEAQAERDCARAERDVAVADIEQMAVSLPVCMACQFCAHGTEGMECDECDDCYNFVWRGAQGEG